jgi:hypothetical protein
VISPQGRAVLNKLRGEWFAMAKTMQEMLAE